MTISRFTAWSMWFVASLFYAYQYILRVMPNIMMSDIMQQYNINATMFGQFSGIYYIGYSLMHIPLGIMLDRYGPKKIIPVCMVTAVIGLLPILFTNIWIYPIIGRLLIGMGSSGAILGVFKIIRFAFPENQFTKMLSFSVTIGLLGAIYGGVPVKYMCTAIGYQPVVALFAVVGILLAFVAYYITPKMHMQQASSSFAHIKEIATSTKLFIVCILSGLLVGPLEGFADVWGTVFLTKVYHLAPALAASLPSAIFLGMCFGGPVLSFIAEKTSYIGTIAAAGFVMATIFGMLVSGILPVKLMSGAFIIVGICCAYQIIAIYKAATYVKKDAIGLATALANMIIMIFGYLFHTAIGLVVSKAGGVALSHALVSGVAVIPVMLFVGSCGFIVVALHDRLQRRKA